MDLKKQREKWGLTLDEVAEYVGVSKSTVSRWESGGIANMRRDRIYLLSKILKIDPTDLMFAEENSVKDKQRVPVLGYVCAGIPIEAVEEILDYEEITPEMARQGEYFGLKIKGDSMEPKFSEGDVVIVRKQSTVDNGQIAVVLVNGGDATVKRFYRSEAGIQLVATNPAYEPLFFTPAEVESKPVKVIGKVVELRAKF